MGSTIVFAKIFMPVLLAQRGLLSNFDCKQLLYATASIQ
jgi:hypothetical protein